MKKIFFKIKDFILTKYEYWKYGPIYCPVCGTCGEDGCCNSAIHASIHLQKGGKPCLYAEKLRADLIFDDLLSEKLYEKYLDKEIFDECWDEVYGRKKEE